MGPVQKNQTTSLRGLKKVNGEWALMATTHNILKLFRASIAPA